MLERLTLGCLADTPRETQAALLQELYTPALDAAWFDFARANRVAPIVAHALIDSRGGSTPAPWIEAHRLGLLRLRSFLAELDRVGELFASRGVRVAALKNAGIARAIHPCPGCCPMGDLDLLVDRGRLAEAHRLLLSFGYRAASRSPCEAPGLEAGLRTGGVEYHKRLDCGRRLWLELQWRPVAGRWIRPDQEPDGGELLDRSLAIPGSAVRLLAPLDNLLQVALHTAKHSYVRAPGIRLHTDVDRIVRRQRIDWPRFVDRVRELRVRTAVYFSLGLAAELLLTPVPEEVLRALRPGARRASWVRGRIERAGLFCTARGPKFSRLGYAAFNALLYDDLRGLCRAAFPGSEWMRARYGLRHAAALPAYHVRRWAELLLGRRPSFR